MTIFNTPFFGLALILFISALIFRIKLYKKASSSSVDSHYWNLASRAYREQRGLPVKIHNKYILEPEIQAYPPFFGILLGRALPKSLVQYGTLIVEGLEFFFLAFLMYFLKAAPEGVFLALAFYISAPILVVYNAQLTPRALGNFFLSCALIFQVLAGAHYVKGYQEFICWLLSALMIGLMLMTHKMTYQLYLVLLPFLALSLNSFNVLYAGIFGFLFYIFCVGYEFAKLQFRAHWEILCFWGEHWRNLGAHQFMHSPIYGQVGADRSSFFHRPGWNGIIKHLKVVIAYAPISFVLPICSLSLGVWPPTWLLSWLGVTYAWIFLTLFNPYMKRFGGGHLYVFNAVIPAIIYTSFLTSTTEVNFYLLIAVALTLTSLYFGWRTVSNRPMARGGDFDDLIEHIKPWNPARLAVFPLQAAEPVAERTPHAVLWGGHGLDFIRLEGFFPILTKPLYDFIYQNKIEWMVWDSTYLTNGVEIMQLEGIILPSNTISFGNWRLSPVKKLACNASP